MDQFEIDSDNTSFEPVNLNMARSAAPPSFQNDYVPNTTTNTTTTTTNPNNNPNINNAATTNPATSSWFQKLTNCFTISSLEKHFNIDTMDFKHRIVSSIMDANKPNHFREQVLHSSSSPPNGIPHDGSFHQNTKQPDLYGPVWITMTLVFFLAVTGNTSKFLKTDAEDVQYDIGHLTKAFFIVAFYTFALPSAMCVMLQCIHANVSSSSAATTIGWVEMICIYGYSLVPFVPATVLCLVPFVFLEWLVLLVATGMSLLLILRNVMTPIMRDGASSLSSSSSSQWSAAIFMCIVVCHFVFFLVIKFVFYRHRFGNSSSSGGSSSGGGGGGASTNNDGGSGSEENDFLNDDPAS